MCGIFGFVKTQSGAWTDKALLDNLFILSESRGKESSGLAFRNGDKIGVLKIPERGSALIKSRTYKQALKELDCPAAVIGHARLVTNGLLEDNLNNQPVIRDGIVGVHNGIIVNDKDIWRELPDLKNNGGVDTEALLALIRNTEKQEQSLIEATRKAFDRVEGTASIALLFNDYPYLLLATNNGSLYFFEEAGGIVFASEEYILESLVRRLKLKNVNISRLEPNQGCLVALKNGRGTMFSLKDLGVSENIEKGRPLEIADLSDYKIRHGELPPSLVTKIELPSDFPKLNTEPIASIKRCSRCILPATMPFINFDISSVCNYCRNYQKTKLRPESELAQRMAELKSKNSKFDCVVPLSGGRDSSYALHYVRRVLGLNPIAYSYDWGMLTDLGRRNQARMCGKLGVEHILVSADIRKKRDNIRKNVIAWLKKPNLGIIPLFMAGDKQYFRFANELSKNTGGSPILYAENPYEKTDFKSGFCGVPPKFGIEHVYDLGLVNKLRLGSYYLGQYIQNPSLINSSIIDTLDAYISSYFTPHDYLSLYLYKKWNETEIVSTLLQTYNWELADDTKTSWRIGDGTAAFYNFIYYAVAGLTEADTFRSNQIREGGLDRNTALKLAQEENTPRYQSIKWYCDIVGLDFKGTLEKILEIPRIY